jgi:hypothetical protein
MTFVVLSLVMKTALAVLLMAQLVAPNVKLPQIMTANFTQASPVKAGRKANVTVSFSLLKEYKINREPTITLEIKPVTGVKLEATTIEASPVDKKSTDEYYVDLPTLKVGLTAAKAGKYELPGKLTYFFCSKVDGFCAKQSVDVKIPLQAE